MGPRRRNASVGAGGVSMLESEELTMRSAYKSNFA